MILKTVIRLAAGIALTAATLCAAGNRTAVINSMHDLSVGTTTGADACIFCHAPHNVDPKILPLWDHALSTYTYLNTTYASSTYTSGVQTPSAGSSRLCLSCHDGAIGLGMTIATNVTVSTTRKLLPEEMLGSIVTPTSPVANPLSNSHPLAMTPVDDGGLFAGLFSASPVSSDPTNVKLFSSKIECATCHDPHVPNKDATASTMFLVKSNAAGALCLNCHDQTRVTPNPLYQWGLGAHASATNGPNPSPTVTANINAAPYTTGPITGTYSVGRFSYGKVSDNACWSCHSTHNNTNTGTAQRSLKAFEENVCTACHGSSVTGAATVIPVTPLTNIGNEFSKSTAKPYSHPTMTVYSVHDPTESVAPFNGTRHAECVDCHNPHVAQAQPNPAVAPAMPATLLGTSGWDGSSVRPAATTEAQICFKCHAGSTNKVTTGATYGRIPIRYPGGTGTTPPTGTTQPTRPADPYNELFRFTGTIGHNILGSSIITTTNASLRPFMLNVNGTASTRALTTTTVLYCQDCHNNDQARASGGTGPNGTHGSLYSHLLQLNLFQDTVSGIGGGTASNTPSVNGAMCNKCHDVTNVIQKERPHNDDSEHLRTGCTSCHDPHGVIGGNPTANRAMMNFDTGVLTPSGSKVWGYYYNVGGKSGCYCTCHEDHNPKTY